MELPHLLDPYYDHNHRGRRTAEGEVRTVITFSIPFILYLCFFNVLSLCAGAAPPRVRTHDGLEEMRYDERYTPLLRRASLDVVSYQVRRGLPHFNPAAITALVDRYILFATQNAMYYII